MAEHDRDRFTERYLGKVGELTLKGTNLHQFETQLVKNLRSALGSVDSHVWLQSGRLYVSCPPESCSAVEFSLDHLMGITGWAKVRAVRKSIGDISDAVYDCAREAACGGAASFKIEARREDKRFPLTSYQICTEAAGKVYDSGLLPVNVHSPDVVIHVEVRDECYVYASQKKTCRGLPVGVSGKGLLLLSGGLDSPVAGWRMLSRGMRLECVYFHSYPYTSEEAQKKVQDLARILATYGLETHLNVIPFTDVQMRIKERSPEPYRTLMLRLCMMKCSSILAERIGAQCLVTGESLGQVASQTIENMSVTEAFCSLPLLRPLVGTDKEAIVETARAIGTYDTSILPYEDCCVLFSPRHPVLRANVEEATSLFRQLDCAELLQKAFESRTLFRYTLRDVIRAEMVHTQPLGVK